MFCTKCSIFLFALNLKQDPLNKLNICKLFWERVSNISERFIDNLDQTKKSSTFFLQIWVLTEFLNILPGKSLLPLFFVSSKDKRICLKFRSNVSVLSVKTYKLAYFHFKLFADFCLSILYDFFMKFWKVIK